MRLFISRLKVARHTLKFKKDVLKELKIALTFRHNVIRSLLDFKKSKIYTKIIVAVEVNSIIKFTRLTLRK